ncbi:hypothetical protein CF394_09155 [Tetzosporium hominis]|uniref:Uncharacterized protein n=1 Tax=Tetzosporium hominis TaxID=2020506 RepID=A0A264W2W7_9BACL|nr:hypothetical protein [Tetzosporium hominis]OZS77912.1 hypothetical protein CF394_09155 [Tetzosporium hominis]
MNPTTWTIRKLVNGAILIPAVFIALLVSATLELSGWITVLIAIALTAVLFVIVNRWKALDRPISKTTYTIWNVVIILSFVIIYYTIRTSM